MSTTDLLDVNVWLALAYPRHTHHLAARAYWDKAAEAATRLAFCRTTMQGFLRLVTQPAVMGEAVHTVAEAWQIYNAQLASGRVEFLAEPPSVESVLVRYSSTPGFRVRDWTDAYLASFAVTAHCRIVSFDGGFAQYDALDFLHLCA